MAKKGLIEEVRPAVLGSKGWTESSGVQVASPIMLSGLLD